MLRRVNRNLRFLGPMYKMCNAYQVSMAVGCKIALAAMGVILCRG